MNRPSLDKYEDLVKPGGVLVVNTSMVDRETNRTRHQGGQGACQRKSPKSWATNA